MFSQLCLCFVKWILLIFKSFKHDYCVSGSVGRWSVGWWVSGRWSGCRWSVDLIKPNDVTTLPLIDKINQWVRLSSWHFRSIFLVKNVPRKNQHWKKLNNTVHQKWWKVSQFFFWSLGMNVFYRLQSNILLLLTKQYEYPFIIIILLLILLLTVLLSS